MVAAVAATALATALLDDDFDDGIDSWEIRGLGIGFVGFGGGRNG